MNLTIIRRYFDLFYSALCAAIAICLWNAESVLWGSLALYVINSFILNRRIEALVDQNDKLGHFLFLLVNQECDVMKTSEGNIRLIKRER